jgi:hypothetical protein
MTDVHFKREHTTLQIMKFLHFFLFGSESAFPMRIQNRIQQTKTNADPYEYRSPRLIVTTQLLLYV